MTIAVTFSLKDVQQIRLPQIPSTNLIIRYSLLTHSLHVVNCQLLTASLNQQAHAVFTDALESTAGFPSLVRLMDCLDPVRRGSIFHTLVFWDVKPCSLMTTYITPFTSWRHKQHVHLTDLTAPFHDPADHKMFLQQTYDYISAFALIYWCKPQNAIPVHRAECYWTRTFRLQSTNTISLATSCTGRLTTHFFIACSFLTNHTQISSGESCFRSWNDIWRDRANNLEVV